MRRIHQIIDHLSAKLAFLLFALLLPFQGWALSYSTEALAPNVKSLQLYEMNVSDLPPIFRMGSTDQLLLSFDLIDNEPRYLYYEILHYNADGTRSTLTESEYLDGFNNNPLESGRPSFNTFMNYYHYSLAFPNQNINFRVSGNYLIVIYEEGQKEKPLLKATFGVSEESAQLGAMVTTRTDIDYNKSHQQLEVKTRLTGARINNPAAELRLEITQNRRPDNKAVLTQAMPLSTSELVYRNQPGLIFEAGNEFRRFETTNRRYGGLRIESIQYFNPFYHATIEADQPRERDSYLYDQDQDGRMLIRSVDASDSEVEADYFVTHFRLFGIDPLVNGRIYLYGEMTNFQLNEQSHMKYNFELQCFEKAIPLKQGVYNYHYLFLPSGEKRATTSMIEGNKYETENEYHIRLYHRPFGERYDRLISTLTIYSNK